jgi:sterol desaturase/sphingolipid hydroxylase (fatty acid hydroxylase superfamily)
MLESHPALLRGAIFFGVLLLFLVLELSIPYRKSTVSKAKRWLINLGMVGVNNVVLTLVFGSAPLLLAAYVSQNGLGILPKIPAPYWLKVLIVLMFLDFMLWTWHLLNHVVPFLWRFHRVHHTDLNMDATTATRFHIGELSISMVIKMALIYILGADVFMVLLFDTLVVAVAQFHHSSLKVPARFEKIIHPLFVPPSMHRIHHSVKIKERDTNYGTLFSLWDRFMGTLLTNVRQEGIKIGVGGHYDEKKLNLQHLLVMPFTRNVR